MHQETTGMIENDNNNFSNGNSKALKLHFNHDIHLYILFEVGVIGI